MRQTCINMIYELAKQDERVIFIGSDLSPNLLAPMKDEFPERFFMEGVSEANIIGMAAGLAMEGFIPYVNTIATFITRRCYEQITVDVCMHNLPIRLIGNGGGVVYAPLGPTHLATDDISIMRSLPNMTIVAACDANEMTRLMNATLTWQQPMYIRLGKGGDEIISRPEKPFGIGTAIHLYQSFRTQSQHVLLISTGVMTQRCLQVAKYLETQSISTTLLHCHTIKPLDTATILFHAKQASLVVTVEENTLIGGLGSAVTDCITEKFGKNIPPIKRFGLPDKFPDKYGSQELLLDYFGLSVTSLSNEIVGILSY